MGGNGASCRGYMGVVSGFAKSTKHPSNWEQLLG